MKIILILTVIAWDGVAVQKITVESMSNCEALGKRWVKTAEKMDRISGAFYICQNGRN